MELESSTAAAAPKPDRTILVQQHDDTAQFNRHWRRCKRDTVPFMRALIRRKYAVIHLDMLPARRYLDVETLAAIVNSLRAVHVDGPFMYDRFGVIIGVPIADGERIAREVFRLANATPGETGTAAAEGESSTRAA